MPVPDLIHLGLDLGEDNAFLLFLLFELLFSDQLDQLGTPGGEEGLRFQFSNHVLEILADEGSPLYK